MCISRKNAEIQTLVTILLAYRAGPWQSEKRIGFVKRGTAGIVPKKKLIYGSFNKKSIINHDTSWYIIGFWAMINHGIFRLIAYHSHRFHPKNQPSTPDLQSFGNWFGVFSSVSKVFSANSSVSCTLRPGSRRSIASAWRRGRCEAFGNRQQDLYIIWGPPNITGLV